MSRDPMPCRTCPAGSEGRSGRRPGSGSPGASGRIAADPGRGSGRSEPPSARPPYQCPITKPWRARPSTGSTSKAAQRPPRVSWEISRTRQPSRSSTSRPSRGRGGMPSAASLHPRQKASKSGGASGAPMFSRSSRVRPCVGSKSKGWPANGMGRLRAAARGLPPGGSRERSGSGVDHRCFPCALIRLTLLSHRSGACGRGRTVPRGPSVGCRARYRSVTMTPLVRPRTAATE